MKNLCKELTVNLFGYLWTNLYMGIGIAADIYAATLGSFREFTDDKYRRNWVWRNTLTHTVFPLVGMYTVVAGIAVWGPLQSSLFLIGAVMLGLFLRHLVRDKSGADCADDESSKQDEDGILAGLIRRVEKVDPQWALVLGVSIDAINSGFAKAADTLEWSLPLLLLSFPLVGCVVGAGALAGGQKAKWFLSLMRKQSGPDVAVLARRLSKLEFGAFLVEIFVLGYFFWRSAANVFVPFGVPDWVDSRLVAWGASGVTSVIVLFFYGEEIVRNIDNEALESFSDNDGKNKHGAGKHH